MMMTMIPTLQRPILKTKKTIPPVRMATAMKAAIEAGYHAKPRCCPQRAAQQAAAAPESRRVW